MRDWMHELENGGYEPGSDSAASAKKAAELRNKAVDGYSHGPIVRRDNQHLSNSELTRRIEERTRAGLPVGRLLAEYDSRVK